MIIPELIAADMDAAIKQARNEALEEAAKVAEPYIGECAAGVGPKIADKIRGLKDE